MLRPSLLALVISLLVSPVVLPEGTGTESPCVVSGDKIQGVYEFISETVVLTKPKKISGQRTQPDWVGQWHFQDGYYTRVLMKKFRETSVNGKNLDELGFESFAGTYRVGEKKVQLKQSYSINPLYVGRPTFMDYCIDGDKLILTETLTPHLEDSTEGTVTIVLRRLK